MKRLSHNACLLILWLTATVLPGLTSCKYLDYRKYFTVDRPIGAPPGPVPDNAFGATGTVRRHNPKDHCTEGDVNYYLNLGGDILVRLAVHGSDNDIRALERAIRTGELVFVTGIRYPGPTNTCYYLLVNRVVPLGVQPEKQKPRATYQKSTTAAEDTNLK